MTRYPYSMGDSQDFREDFLNRQTIADNGGTIIGGVTLSGGEATFDGTSGQIVYPVERIQPTKKGTIAIWVKLNELGSTQYIFTSAWDGGLNNYFIFNVSAVNKLQYIQRNNDTASTVNGSTVLETGIWYRAVLTSDGSAIQMYLDGVAESMSTSGGVDNGDWLGDTDLRSNFVVSGLIRSSVSYDPLSVRQIEVTTQPWTEQEALDDFNNSTYTALDASKALISLPGRTRFLKTYEITDIEDFDEPFTSQASVEANGGTVTGVTFSGGAVYNASNDEITYSAQTGLFNNASMSIRIVFTPDFDNDSGSPHYFYDSTGNRNYVLISGASGNMQVAFNDIQVADIASAIVKAAWKTNQENILTISSTTGDTTVRLNGAIMLQSGTTAWTPDMITTLFLGNNQTSNTAFSGTIHSFEVWQDKLTFYNEVTENLGTLDDLLTGDGSTSSIFPAFNPPKEISFDGFDYLKTEEAITITTSDSFLFHALLSTTDTGATRYIIDLRDGANEGLAIYKNGAGQIVAFTNDGSLNAVTGSKVINDGSEHDLVVTFNNVSVTRVNISIRIDGELDISTEVDIWSVITNEIFIGATIGSSAAWVGTMKDIGFWRKTGTPRQARWLQQRSLKELNI